MNKLKGCLWLVAIIIMLTTISPLAYGSPASQSLPGEAQDQLVSGVKVILEFPDGKEVYSEIQDRIAESIEKVANTILVGREISVIKKTRAEIIQVLEIVFDKVLWGYQVNDVGLLVDEETVIILNLKPTSVLIENVKVNVEIPEINDKIVQVVDKELEQVQDKVRDVLLGLPVEALTWASDVIQPILYHLIKWQIPGFEPTIDLEIGPEICVNLELVPTGQLIEDININIITQSLPRLLSSALEKRLEAELAIFQGMPVALIDQYQDKVIQVIDEAIYHNGRNKYLYLNQSPKIIPGSTTDLTIDVDWIDYKVDFVAEVCIEKDVIDPALYLGFKKRIGPETSLGLQDKITLHKPLGTYSIRIEHNFGAGFTTDIAYTFFEARFDATLDWRHDKYGVTVSQSYPGDITNSKVALNYYPGPHTMISLSRANQKLGLSLQQSL